jgi:hypothetical protein
VEEVPVQADVAIPEAGDPGIIQAAVGEAVPALAQEEPVVIDGTARIKGFIESIFDGKNVKPEDVITGDDPEVQGYIQSIQSAPFYDKLLSFEVVNDEEKSVRLILYNTESQFLAQISAIDDYGNNIKMIPYPVKDQRVNWHPNKNYFIFQSNGYENREQLFMVEITDQYLMEDAPVKITRIDFEEPKRTVNHCMHADFNSTGDDLYFTVRIQKEDKKEKFNKYNNVAVAKNIFKYKDSDYAKVKYELLFNKKFDQLKPVCSPIDPDMLAFISHKKEVREGFGYSEYSLVLYDGSTNNTVVIDNMSGFTEYPCQWSPSGKKLFYCKALPLNKTNQKFRDQRINTINLQVADIIVKDGKIEAVLEKNATSEVIMGDVATKANGIAFVGDDLVMMAKYDPYEAIFLVDMNKWRNNDGFYVKQLPIDRDNDFPVVTSDSFVYMRYDYYKEATVSTVAKIPYEPKIDEEAAKAKAERRAKKKARRNKDTDGEVQAEPAQPEIPPAEEAPQEVPLDAPSEIQGE